MTILRLLLVLSLAALAGCRIEIAVPDGGAVATRSGNYLCRTGDICTIDVVDLFFDETFETRTMAGYSFTGWRRQHRGLCGGSSKPCQLTAWQFAGNPALNALLQSDQLFYLEPEFRLDGTGPRYNERYCEVLLAVWVNGELQADVYGTPGLNDCPQEQLEAVDIDALRDQYGAFTGLLNGPRFWVLDNISGSGERPLDGIAGGPGEVVSLGGLQMRLLATVILPREFITGGAARYRVATVARDTVFHYVAGRRIYELTDTLGTRYIMQSFSRIVDRDLQLRELADLDDRLQLPEGWRFKTYFLDRALDLPSDNGFARVITDDLGNTYQEVP